MKCAGSINTANLDTMIFEIRLRLPNFFYCELRTAEQVETSTDSSQLDTVVAKPASSFNDSNNIPIRTSQCREGKLHRSLLIGPIHRLHRGRRNLWMVRYLSCSGCEFVCSDIDCAEHWTRGCSAHSQRSV